jgi:deoxycytidylate deaminase
MVKILDRSLEMSHSLLPMEYNNRSGYRTYHFSFIWRRNKLLATGINGVSQSPKCVKMGQTFNSQYMQEYPYVHAEIDAISKLWGRIEITGSLAMVVIRLNKYGKLMESRPCQHCMPVLAKLGLTKKLYYSSSGDMVGYRPQ